MGWHLLLNPRAIAIAAAVALAAYVGWLKWDNLSLEASNFQLRADVATAVDVAQSNFEALEDERGRSLRLAQTLQDLQQDQAIIIDRAARAREAVANAPAEDDAPVAPVLRDVFRRMYEVPSDES